MKCPNCGKEIANESVFCEYCGAKIDITTGVEKKKTNWLGIIGGSALLIVGLLIMFHSWGNKTSQSENIKLTGTVYYGTYTPKPISGNIQKEDFQMRYRVVASQAKVYEYDGEGMNDLGISYRNGMILPGEHWSLDGIGEYILVNYGCDGAQKWGFISLSDVEEVTNF